MTNVADVVRRFFRHRRDENLPIVLDQRRIYILPTKSGLLFAGVLVVMLLTAVNYNLALGHALVFLLVGLGLVSMVHSFRNLVDLRLTPGRAEAVFAGEPALFPMHLENARSEARRALDIAFAGGPPVRIDLAAGDLVSPAVPFPTSRRGRLEPGRLTLWSTYPLGLFRAWSYPYPALTCLVYPRPIDHPLPVPAEARSSGVRHGASGDEDFAGLRLRQPYDSPRHIAWKSVARDYDHRPLLVKQFAGGATEEIVLDWEQADFAGNLEDRLSILAGWVVAAERRHLRYALRLPGRSIPPAHGPAHYAACLEALALHD